MTNPIQVDVKDAANVTVTLDTIGSLILPTANMNAAVTSGLTAINTNVLGANASLVTISTELGTVTETAPGTDTASSGLNGRIQRACQRLTTLITQLPLVFGSGTSAAAQRVTIATDQAQLTNALKVDGSANTQPVNGFITFIGNTFTRPADTNNYVAGDLIANNTTNTNIGIISLPIGRTANGTGMIRRIRIKTNDIANNAWKGAVIRSHFFKNMPVTTVGDNGVFNSSDVMACSESDYLGYCDVALDKAFTDVTKGIGVPSIGSEINWDCATGTNNIFALFETRSAIVSPGSAKTFTIVVEAHQN